MKKITSEKQKKRTDKGEKKRVGKKKKKTNLYFRLSFSPTHFSSLFFFFASVFFFFHVSPSVLHITPFLYPSLHRCVPVHTLPLHLL